MPAHLPSYPHKRQAPADMPSGFTGVETVTAADGSGPGTLLTNASVTGSSTPSAPALASGVTPTTTQPSTATITSSPSPAAASGSSSTSTNSKSGQISMGAVIGACVGAFLSLILVVLFALWCNRRLSRTLKNRRERAQPSPLSDNRNVTGETARRRSRLEPWAKLGEGDDTWEGMHQAQTKEVDNGAMEKLTMFKKSSSIRSGEKYTSSDGHEVDLGEPVPFARYHPQLAEELAKTPQRQFLGRLDPSNDPISWDGETVGDDSFLSLRNSRMNSIPSSGSLSPTLAVLRSTPAAVSHQHKWESAEVMHYGEDTEEIQEGAPNPFLGEQVERRKSLSNTFFSGQSGAPTRRSRNPFMDPAAPPMPRADSGIQSTHNTSSSAGNDRAIQLLLAALEATPDAAITRTSMQSSFISNNSAMTGEDVAATSFPLPPGGPR